MFRKPLCQSLSLTIPLCVPCAPVFANETMELDAVAISAMRGRSEAGKTPQTMSVGRGRTFTLGYQLDF